MKIEDLIFFVLICQYRPIQHLTFTKTRPILHTIREHFHEFFTFLTIFLVKSKLSTAKKSKTAAFSRVFHPKKSTIFSGNQSWLFGQKIKISNSVLYDGEDMKEFLVKSNRKTFFIAFLGSFPTIIEASDTLGFGMAWRDFNRENLGHHSFLFRLNCKDLHNLLNVFVLLYVCSTV